MPAAELSVTYFDGRSAQAHPVRIRLQGQTLLIRGAGIDRQVDLADVDWPERTRHGVRLAHLRAGGTLQCDDPTAWDAWRLEAGHREPLVVRLQQSWRWVALCLLGFAAMLIALQQWGIPVLARGLVALTPMQVDSALGQATLATVDSRMMLPSQLPMAEQDRIRSAFDHALTSLPRGTVPEWNLQFRKSRIGPNALGLPGGTIILTDELVTLVGQDEEVLVGVLAHELGHVRHRDGLRLLYQISLLSGLSGLVLGDPSALLAAVPALLGQASYSRNAEHAADVEAVRVLRAARISPLVMVKMFDRLAEARAAQQGPDKTRDSSAGDWLGIAFGSHPPDAERIRFFSAEALSR